MAKGGYTPEQIRGMSSDEIFFLHHYQSKVDESKAATLAEMLGVMFDFEKQDFSEPSPDASSHVSGKLYVPLSFILQPEFAKKVTELSQKKSYKKPAYIGGGEHRQQANENIVSMSELSKEDFMALLGRKS